MGGWGWSSASHTDLESEGIHVENTTHPRILSRGRVVMQVWDVMKGIRGDSKQPGDWQDRKLLSFQTVGPERKKHCQKPEGNHDLGADFFGRSWGSRGW